MPVPMEVVADKITVNLALTMLHAAGRHISRQAVYRQLRRRKVALYRVGSTLMFSPAIINDILADR